MKTTIDNTQKVFLILTEREKYFVNLDYIPEIYSLVKNQDFEIKMFWNNKFQKISKKDLNEMFDYNQIDFQL